MAVDEGQRDRAHRLVERVELGGRARNAGIPVDATKVIVARWSGGAQSVLQSAGAKRSLSASVGSRATPALRADAPGRQSVAGASVGRPRARHEAGGVVVADHVRQPKFGVERPVIAFVGGGDADLLAHALELSRIEGRDRRMHHDVDRLREGGGPGRPQIVTVPRLPHWPSRCSSPESEPADWKRPLRLARAIGPMDIAGPALSRDYSAWSTRSLSSIVSSP